MISDPIFTSKGNCFLSTNFGQTVTKQCWWFLSSCGLIAPCLCTTTTYTHSTTVTVLPENNLITDTCVASKPLPQHQYYITHKSAILGASQLTVSSHICHQYIHHVNTTSQHLMSTYIHSYCLTIYMCSTSSMSYNLRTWLMSWNYKYS